MSCYVTYNLRVIDVQGEEMGTLPVRAVCAPPQGLALELAREAFGKYVGGVEVQRSVPAKIGRITPAVVHVSARVKVLALSPGLEPTSGGHMFVVTVKEFDESTHHNVVVWSFEVEGEEAARQRAATINDGGIGLLADVTPVAA